jgi:peptidoglycan/xylan/chitin deacetylase (PgdA/CDA1 family)
MQYFNNYREVKKLKPSGLRGHLRNAALHGLSWIDKLRGIEDQLKKPRVQFLYIHHIFKDEEHHLRNLLQKLQKYHTFISYSEGIDRIINQRIDKPYVVLSSDDGFKNNINAARIFNEYGAKGCFFINPSIVGETNFGVIETYCQSRLHFPPVEFLNWNEVNTLQKMGHEVGSHTMNHINVAETSSAAIAQDMNDSYQELHKRCGDIKHFAYPYGRFFHFNETGRKACFDAGFISCATAERGCHINHERMLAHDELCILRDHIMLDWNVNHILHFLSANSKAARFSNNLFPYDK